MASPIRASDCYPVELHFIKALFLDGQYRRCIQACRDILQVSGNGVDGQLLHAAFVHFYLGLAHDAMARKMHPNSVARLPALNSAAQAFVEAIESLPSLEATRSFCRQDPLLTSRDSFISAEDSRNSLLHSQSSVHYFSFESAHSSSSLPSSPPFYPVKSPRHPPSPQSQAIDYDYDLESEESFSQLMTPNRIRRRDFSMMTLLDDPPHVLELPREASRMSLLESPPRRSFQQPGLLRQVQPGSSRAMTSSALPEYNIRVPIPLRLPQLVSRAQTEPHLGPSRLSCSFTPEPVSPMSPSAYNRRWSNASTISAVSPQTPVRHDSAFDPSPSSADFEAVEAVEAAKAEERVISLFDHTHALKELLQCHVSSIRNLTKQTESMTACPLPISISPLERVNPTPDCFSSPSRGSDKMVQSLNDGRIQQARSYWSFVPENVKESEKKKRIADGRQRKWKRKRFDPTRYQELCEKALAGL